MSFRLFALLVCLAALGCKSDPDAAAPTGEEAVAAQQEKLRSIDQQVLDEEGKTRK
jgi:hypothetical protein